MAGVSHIPRPLYIFDYYNYYFSINQFVKLEYLDVTVLRRGVGEVLVVAGRSPACQEVWRGMQDRRSLYKEER
jgi:hypothetical protein